MHPNRPRLPGKQLAPWRVKVNSLLSRVTMGRFGGPHTRTAQPSDIQPGKTIAVRAASYKRVALAQAIDGAIVAGVGCLLTAVEGFMSDRPWRSPEWDGLQVVAGWLHTHMDAVIHGAILAGVTIVAMNVIPGPRSGRSLGRLTTGTVLVSFHGLRLSWRQLIIRGIISLLSVSLFGAGYFWAIVDRYHRTWHDLVADTVTVERKVRLQ